MPNPLKFSGSAFSTNILSENHFRNRNFFIGTTGNYGPSYTTGWYNGATPSLGSYNIFYKNSEAFNFHSVSDTGVKSLLEGYFGHELSGSWEGIMSASMADDICVLNKDLPNIPTKTPFLQYYFNADLTPSYASGSSTTFNISPFPVDTSGSLLRGTGSGDYISGSTSLWENGVINGGSGSWGFKGDDFFEPNDTREFIETNITNNSIFSNSRGFTIGAWMYIPSSSQTAGQMPYTLFDKSDRTSLITHDGFTINLTYVESGLPPPFPAYAIRPEIVIDNTTYTFGKSFTSLIRFDTWVLVTWEIQPRFIIQRYKTSPSTIAEYILEDSNINNSGITTNETLQVGRLYGEGQTPGQGNNPINYLSGSINSFFVYGAGFTTSSLNQIYDATRIVRSA